MNTILVSGASGIVGYGILKSLRASGLNLYLIGTTIYEESIASAFCDKVLIAPKTNEPGYLEWLLNVINSNKIDLIIPGIEIDMFHWSENLDHLSASGTRVCVNNRDLIVLCKDKWNFFTFLKEHNTSYIIPTSINNHFESSVETYGLPLLLKPRQGFGSQGIVRVKVKTDWAGHQHEIGTHLMVQPIVGSDSEEYSISAYGNGEGELLALMSLRRTLSKDGYTQYAEVANSDILNRAVTELAGIFKPFGPTNFQFRLTEDGPKLLEINPRISSSTSIRTGFGYNESSMVVKHLLFGNVPSQPELKNGWAMRYVEEKFFIK